MNITKESTGDLTAIVRIELNKDDYEKEVNIALKDYQRKANIPGFRPGKVPFGMVKKMYGNAVMADKINSILSESLSTYIKDNDLKILGNPLPNAEKTKAVDFLNQTEFDFYFDIGFAPNFDLEMSDSIDVDYYKIKIEDKMVDNYLEDMRKRNGSPVNPEVSEKEDKLYGKFVELDNAGSVLENGISHKASVLPEYIKLEEVREKLVGLKIADKIIFNPLKATESVTETAAILGIKSEEAEKLESDFQFTVEEITRITLANLDEEFFSKVYPNMGIKTEIELREQIKKDTAVAYDKESEKQFMNNAIEKLIETADLPLPDDFLRRWLKENNEDKITEEQIEGQYDSFARSMRWHLIESKIVEDHKIEVNDGDVRSEIKNYFTSQLPEDNRDEEDERLSGIVDSVMANKEEVKKISDNLFDDKLLSLFKAKLTISEKDISYEEFVKIASTIKN